MHAYDHGVAMTIITAIMHMLQILAEKLGIGTNALVVKLSSRMHNLCNTLEVKHTTLMSFVNQSIVDCMDSYLARQGTKKARSQPIVDASDVQRLMLALPFLLAGLACEELEQFNALLSPAEQEQDPIPEAIEAVNAWLHWYHLYRQPESGTYTHVLACIGKYNGMYSHVFVRILADSASHARLDGMGVALLDTLQRVFPYTVKLAPRSALTRSIWCTEKVHSIVHGSRNLRCVGRSRNITCQVTESRLKGLKAKGHMTNRHQATYGWSIMRAEIRECAAQEMARQADARGAQCMYLVCSVLYCVCIVMYLFILACIWYLQPKIGTELI